jgi:hypothetical protein
MTLRVDVAEETILKKFKMRTVLNTFTLDILPAKSLLLGVNILPNQVSLFGTQPYLLEVLNATQFIFRI